MSIAEGNQPVAGQTGMPDWDEKAKRLKMQRWFRFLVALIVILWVLLILWVAFRAPIKNVTASPLDVGANLTIVLAPILVAAAAVERTLESAFNTIEGSWRSMVAYLGRGMRWLKNAEIEVQHARQFLADAADKYNEEMQNIRVGDVSVSALTNTVRTRLDDANRMMAVAQARLADAESNLSDITSSDGYITAKAAASIIVGLMLGVIIAAIGQLQMFAMLGIDAVPAKFDVFVTGLVIGSGSYPVHSLVGILQQTKGTLDSVKGYFNRLSPEAQATQQKITTVQPSMEPGEPALVQQSVIETTTAKTTEEGPNK